MINVLSRRFLVALLVAGISAATFSAGYFQENGEAYLFPTILGGMLLLFSLISLVREAFGICVDDFQSFPFIRQLPVILMMSAAVLLVEHLGMYTTAFCVLLTVSLWYSPEEDTRKRVIRSLAFSAGFTAFMYGLFALGLNVQTPRGILL